jgi:DNA-binding NtrC family response regulator
MPAKRKKARRQHKTAGTLTAAPAVIPTILVVETDLAGRAHLYGAFLRAGFNVLLAGSGESAVTVYTRMQRMVRVVLISSQRPSLNASRLLTALKSINPAVRCVVAAELSPDVQLLPLLRQGAATIVSKPIKMDETVRAVRGVLEREALAHV